jgi:hypothetical protein
MVGGRWCQSTERRKDCNHSEFLLNESQARMLKLLGAVKVGVAQDVADLFDGNALAKPLLAPELQACNLVSMARSRAAIIDTHSLVQSKCTDRLRLR